MAALALKDVPNVSDDRCREFLTRPYTGSVNERQYRHPRKPANDNVERKHDWPVYDACLANDLMKGRDDVETVALNGKALVILCQVRRFIETAEGHSDWLEHNGAGSVLDDFGAEVNRDYGPSEEMLKSLYEHGSKPSSEGEPWNAGKIELMEKTELGRKIKSLWRVGRLEFNETGRLTRMRGVRSGWFHILDRTRGAKGKRAVSSRPDPEDISSYRGAALPRDERGNLQVDFMAGRLNAIHIGPVEKDDRTAPPKHSASSHDAYSKYMADQDAREAAVADLESLRGLLGARLYEGLVDAAMGLRLDEIGGLRRDKRASAVGRNTVQIAIENVIESRCT